MAHDIFISHSSKDKKIADALCISLENSDMKVWMAPRDLTPGKSYAAQISRAIKNTKCVILVFNSNSFNSHWVRKEIERAVGCCKVILPFILENIELDDEWDLYISSSHWLDVQNTELERATGYLIESVAKLLEVNLNNVEKKQNDFDSYQTFVYGSICINSKIMGDLYLDGKYIGAIAPNHQYNIKKVKIGLHNIEIRTNTISVLQSVKLDKNNQYSSVSIDESTSFTETTAKINIEMVAVEGGTFLMGREGVENLEGPVHKVTLDSFFIGKYPLTQKQWNVVMNNNPSCFVSESNPVENVSWNDVQDFLNKLHGISGKGYRLPTEAEWEFSARGGNLSKGYRYSGSDDIFKVAWFKENSKQITHCVGQKEANELGIYDMSGNVCEWCYDWNTPYIQRAQLNPTGLLLGSKRVRRGGGYISEVDFCTNTFRHFHSPEFRHNYLGFRLVLPFSQTHK